jgi:hypothetical protein
VVEASARDAQREALEQALTEVLVCEEIFERRGLAKAATEARSFEALLRSEIRSLETEARDLRSNPPAQVMPLSLTTRRVGP